MPNDILNEQELAALSALDSPTISNAIEQFDIRPRNVGFSGPELQCMFPGFKPIVGYAATSTIQADQPGAGNRSASRSDYWEYILSTPAPCWSAWTRSPGLTSIPKMLTGVPKSTRWM